MNEKMPEKFHDTNLESREQAEKFEVKDVLERYNALLVHGLNIYTQPHTQTNEIPAWMQKIYDIRNLQPQLSCSSYFAGRQRLFSSFGVILTDGVILDAFPFDAGTLKGQKGQRIIPPKEMFGLKNLNLSQKLDEAFSWDPNRLNEIIVADPKIGGLYLKKSEIELMKTRPDYNYQKAFGARLKDVLSFCKINHMPIYFFEDGKIFSSKMDNKKNQIVIDKPISPFEIIKS